MRSRLPLVALAGIVVVAAASACSSFTAEDENGASEGGSTEDSSMDTFVHDAALDADAGDALDATDPDAFPSTPLVHVLGAGKPFSIEATEVSVAQYNLFKSRYPAPTTFPTELCPQKTKLGPPADGECATTFANNNPMTCVDWCDANAYCQAIGRHLCGDLADGGALTVDKRNDPGADEWYYACRGPGARAYPYGPVVQAGICNTAGSTLMPVGMLTTCEGAESGLLDMSGNAAEWIASCVPGACSVRGGSYVFSAYDSTCGLPFTADPLRAFPDIGFRCCTEP